MTSDSELSQDSPQEYSETLKAVLSLKPSVQPSSPMEQAEEDGNIHGMLKRASSSVMSVSAAKPPSMIRYFGIESESNLSPEIQSLLTSLGDAIFSETSDADEVFMFMKAAEKSMPDIVDPRIRIERLVSFFKSLSESGGIRNYLVESGLLHIDDAEEYGRNTGNWTRALKLAAAHSQSVRK